MMANVKPFGTTPEGQAVEQYTLRAGALSCDILTYGGALRALRVPGRGGRIVDVLLGFDTLEDYRKQDKYLGALVGRVANRIGAVTPEQGGTPRPCFDLNGHSYTLAANDGVTHLHGGLRGFDKQVWTVEDASESTLTLSLCSPHQEENYPGNLEVRVTYTLTEAGLELRYEAVCDQDTLCNLTNHAYFNLAGHGSGPVSEQTIQIFADAYTPTDTGSIPTGEIAPVAGTPLDLREALPIGRYADDGFPQLAYAGGYDHNWVLRGETGTLRSAARAVSKATGIALEVQTTLPGIQFYSGNYLDDCPAGKDGAPYAKRWGFCLETQFFPDSIHHETFQPCILRAGEKWDHRTVFQFSIV